MSCWRVRFVCVGVGESVRMGVGVGVRGVGVRRRADGRRPVGVADGGAGAARSMVAAIRRSRV